MSRVAVTGGSGHAGRFVVDELVRQGHDVLNIDRVDAGRVELLAVDLLEYSATFAALDGCEAVVHLAANPVPDTDHVVGAERFSHNMVTTFNVFQAAVAAGATRVVWASSETVYGYPFQTNRPDSLPLDATSRLQPQNAYALAKVAGERVARDMAATSGVVFVGLRFSNVLVEDPTVPANYAAIPGYWDDPASRSFNLWGYIDARDVATAVARSLVADLEGAHELPVFAADTIMNVPNQELVDAVFPGVPLARGTGDFETLVSIAETSRLLDWHPQYSWRTVLGAG